MKRISFIGLIAAVVLMFGSVAMAGKPGPCLTTGPTSFNCADDAGTAISCTWDNNVIGATKYSVDVVVVSEDEQTVVEQSFSSDTTSITIPYSSFIICGNATAKVKGLNPPQRGVCSQNNAFSAEYQFTIPCP